jgi:enoyl-CoA hydratase/carnithine racemase
VNYEVDGDGIATLALDCRGASQNVLDDATMGAFGAALERALAEPSVKAILIASEKKDFSAGGDLNALLDASLAPSLFARLLDWNRRLRAMETSGKPVAAALPGSALGGGLELALACHYRVAAENPKARFGFPEVTLGLIPGGGGTQRLPRLIGIVPALPLLLEGTQLRAQAALEAGLLHAVVAAGAEREQARQWLRDNRDRAGAARQPWDVGGYRIPGGAVQSPSGVQTFTVANAMLRERTYGNYPAPQNILSCVYEGLQVDIDTGLRIEARYFTATALGYQAKNMIRLVFFGLHETKDCSEIYTRRVVAAYVAEGLALLADGVSPALIDNAGRMAGMPAGPLALAGERAMEPVETIFRPARVQPPVAGVMERLIAIQSLEAVRCMDERIVKRPVDADVGALLGWGYPAFRGGPIGWIHTLGVPEFIATARRLAAAHGPRFEPPASLAEMAARGAVFYPSKATA